MIPESAPAAPAAAPAPARPPRSPDVPLIRLESGAPGGHEPAAAPSGPAPDTVPLPGPAEAIEATAPGVRVQPVPALAACAVPPQRGIAQEREWVRRTFGARYHAAAGTVSRVLSQAPGLRGDSRASEGDTLTDLVAVCLYLEGDSAAVDAAVRGATVGPHVPLARCVAAGLRRLPSYRGAALLRSRVSHAEHAWYRKGRTTTEWAFCTAQAAAHAGTEDGTDFLIWSVTARRTDLLDPTAPDRVVFAPGTTFKVLRAGSDDDGPVLLRELLVSELAQGAGDGGHGGAGARRPALDEIALDGLEQAVQVLAWAQAAAASAPPSAAAPTIPLLGTAPGLIVSASRPRTRTAAGTVASAEGVAP
ncbi:hypothetical protein [Kitasatospora sp. NPDC050543]|uniref:hypothetical protein n=1 Tax=Kitasatospora sp. NPDC050543 TaxID=3364054 RepID=UPI00378CFAC2